MKRRLLDLLRCPACRGGLALSEAGVEGAEVARGILTCAGCSARYDIRDGIPRLIRDDRSSGAAATERTSARFGYLWSQSEVRTAAEPRAYHFDKMAAALDLDEPRGLVLDAGCGDGIDLANHALREGVEIVGVELSDGGCRTAQARVQALPHAHVVQADLRALPFADHAFDRVYSYGVLHHVVSPPAAAAELARVSRPGAEVAIYLYEDFAGRATGWRIGLALVNSTRAVTTRLPPRLLYALCQAASPIIFLLFTVPHRLLKSVPGFGQLARGLPFRHGKGPFGLTGDLYDRFSAPIEYRYSQQTAGDLLGGAGLTVTHVAYERGWMVSARASRPA